MDISLQCDTKNRIYTDICDDCYLCALCFPNLMQSMNALRAKHNKNNGLFNKADMKRPWDKNKRIKSGRIIGAKISFDKAMQKRMNID